MRWRYYVHNLHVFVTMQVHTLASRSINTLCWQICLINASNPRLPSQTFTSFWQICLITASSPGCQSEEEITIAITFGNIEFDRVNSSVSCIHDIGHNTFRCHSISQCSLDWWRIVFGIATSSASYGVATSCGWCCQLWWLCDKLLAPQTETLTRPCPFFPFSLHQDQGG